MWPSVPSCHQSVGICRRKNTLELITLIHSYMAQFSFWQRLLCSAGQKCQYIFIGWDTNAIKYKFLNLGCMTCNFLYLSFSNLYSSSLWWTETIIFAALNKLPSLLIQPPSSPPFSVFEINKPGGGLNRRFKVIERSEKALGARTNNKLTYIPCTMSPQTRIWTWAKLVGC